MAEKKNKKESKKANKKESKQVKKQKLSNPKVIITTTIDVNIHKRARENGISWTKALELGVLILLKEKEKVSEKPSEENPRTEEEAEPVKEEEPIPA